MATPSQPRSPHAFDRIVDRFDRAAERGACGVAGRELARMRAPAPGSLSDDEHLRRVRLASLSGRVFDRRCGEPDWGGE